MSDSPVLAGLSTAGRAIPVALLASLPGLVFLAGFDHLAYGLGLLAGVVLAGMLIAPQVIRSGAATIPEALDRRFGMATAIAGAVIIVLAVLPLLSAELALVGVLAEAGLGVPYFAAVLAALVLGGAALALNERAFSLLCVGAYAMLAASLLVPLILMAAKTHGLVVPQIGYGQALTVLSGLEEKLLENGLVDFDTFSVHVAPFLRLSQLNMVALVVSLALGTAVLPQLVSALSEDRRSAAARTAGAWTALFVMLILISVPALAAYAKLEIYGAIAQGTPLISLPAWLDAPLRADFAHIHGTSLAMLDQVAKAISADGADPSAIADHLAVHSLAMEQRWLALDEQVRTAIVEAARTLGAAPAHDALWQSYVGSVLPAAATGAGNEAAVRTQAALVIEPAGLILALPSLSAAPAWLMMTGVIAAALVFAAALIRCLQPVILVGRRIGFSRAGMFGTALVLVIAAVAAGLATLRPEEIVAVVTASLSLAAAGLFPVLALGLAWRRATAAGAIAAIVFGAGVTLYYDVGIQVFPAAFFKTWAALSNAPEFAVENFRATELDAQEAESEESKAQAAVSLETLARGTPGRPGLANWMGIDSASGAIFGVPLGVLALVLVSLFTGRRRTQP